MREIVSCASFIIARMMSAHGFTSLIAPAP